MLDTDDESLCAKAKYHYYDYVCGAGGPHEFGVTGAYWECAQCQGRSGRLAAYLGGVRLPELLDPEFGKMRTAMLVEHLEYVGQWVTCSVARGFLPALSQRPLRSDMVTPITQHVKHCATCQGDIEVIEEWRVDSRRLHRLERLISDKELPLADHGAAAERVIPAVAHLEFNGIDEALLKHLCRCSACRSKLTEAREEMIRHRAEQNVQQYGKGMPCETMRSEVYFDCLVPYGFNPCEDEHAEARQAMLAHMANCQVCLAAMRVLGGMIYGIYEHEDSGVRTCYRLVGDSLVRAGDEFEVKRVEPAGRAAVGVVEAEPRKETQVRLRQMVHRSKRRLIAAAAVAATLAICTSLVMVLMTVAQATAARKVLADVYSKVAAIDNICISQYSAGSARETQRTWISRSLGAYVVEYPTRLIWYDLAKGVLREKDLATGSIDTKPLTAELVATCERILESTYGIMPFESISEIPEGYQWVRVDSEGEEYDLLWARTGGLLSQKHKVRYLFEDSSSAVPSRVEWYLQKPGKKGYTITHYVEVIPYSSDTEIAAVLEGKFGIGQLGH